MDRSKPEGAVYCSPMQNPRNPSVKLLLQTRGTKRKRIISHATCRRNLHSQAFLRFSKNYPRIEEGRARCESQAHSGNYATLRFSRESAGTEYLEKPPTASQIPVSFKRSCNFRASPGTEYRHHVYSASKWLCVSGCSNRLVQSIGLVLSSLKQSGDHLLLGGFRRGNQDLRATTNFQYRPGSSIYFSRVRECCAWEEYSFQHGWKGARSRQYFCGTSMEICEIRGRILE